MLKLAFPTCEKLAESKGAKMTVEHVDYDVLDSVKNRCIQASKQTLSFAKKYGFVPESKLGASSNVFQLDLSAFCGLPQSHMYVTLLPEGLGTADDARPDGLSPQELREFWYNIAVKTVSCMTNDAATCGAQPVLISLYLPSSEPEKVFDQSFLAGFTEGFVEGCRIVECAWISGETPQLKGKICEGKVDIAGAVFGMVPPGCTPIDGSSLAPGNKILLVGSSGPHENGFTTLRGLAPKLTDGYRTRLSDGRQFWQAINAASKLYSPLVQRLLEEKLAITAIENVTGHGWSKIMRSSKPFCYRIREVPKYLEVFQFIEQHAGVTRQRMHEIFNCGAGYAVFLETEQDAARALEICSAMNYEAVIAGAVEQAETRRVVIEPYEFSLEDSGFQLKKG
jgi:phosphoribosylformylglycinamidine cyclo-ligase